MAQAQKIKTNNLQEGIKTLKEVFAKKEQIAQAQKELNEMQNAIGLWGYGEDTYMPYRIEQSFNNIFDGEKGLAEQAYEVVLAEDVKMAKQYIEYYRANFTYQRESKSLRSAAFNCIVGQADTIWEMLNHDCFNKLELKAIYDTHHKTFFKKMGRGVLDLYDYCRVFKEYTSKEEIDLLVKRILGRKKTQLAKQILSSHDWTLTDEQRGQLDGLMVAEKLRRAR